MYTKRQPVFVPIIALIIITSVTSYRLLTSNHKKVEGDSLTILQNKHTIGFFQGISNRDVANELSVDAHLTLKWMSLQPEPLNKSWISTLRSQRTTLIRIETWAGIKEDPSHVNVLEDVVSGKYDHKIKELCSELKSLQGKVVLTLDPEMEVPVKDFPWQYQSPQLYIAAFRHFFNVVKTANPNLKVIWSTAGYPGVDEYWPGEDAADAIGITVFGKSEGETTTYPVLPNLQSVITRKMFRMRMMNKPILISINASAMELPTYKESFAKATSIYRKQINSLAAPPLNSIGKPRASDAHTVLVGVYDPNKLLLNESSVSTEHLFADWGSVEDGSLARNVDEVNKRHHNLILSMEPWRGQKWPTDPDVLEKISIGHYDPIIEQTLQVVKKTKYTVFLRFAHEMEIPITRYSWQSNDPVIYIKAYRHFMNFFSGLPNVKKVWGPAGDRGSLEWWPGDSWVDYISLAIYGLPDKNITDPLKQESFTTIFNRKNYRMRFVNKPIFITEFGVKGPAVFQEAWLNDAAETIQKNKNIWGVSYFNLADNPEAWGKIAPPNWAVSKLSFQKFSGKVLTKR